MYFDAIVVSDTMQVLFNGTSAETVRFLRSSNLLGAGLSTADVHAAVGETLAILTVDEYVTTMDRVMGAPRKYMTLNALQAGETIEVEGIPVKMRDGAIEVGDLYVGERNSAVKLSGSVHACRR
jgi:hypothetical protein